MTDYEAIYNDAVNDEDVPVGALVEDIHQITHSAGLAAVVAAVKAEALVELGANELRHKVSFKANEFTVEHPLSERLDDSMMGCEYHAMIAAQLGPPSPLGLYWLTRNGRDGSPELELIEATK